MFEVKGYFMSLDSPYSNALIQQLMSRLIWSGTKLKPIDEEDPAKRKDCLESSGSPLLLPCMGVSGLHVDAKYILNRARKYGARRHLLIVFHERASRDRRPVIPSRIPLSDLINDNLIDIVDVVCDPNSGNVPRTSANSRAIDEIKGHYPPSTLSPNFCLICLSVIFFLCCLAVCWVLLPHIRYLIDDENAISNATEEATPPQAEQDCNRLTDNNLRMCFDAASLHPFLHIPDLVCPYFAALIPPFNTRQARPKWRGDHWVGDHKLQMYFSLTTLRYTYHKLPADGCPNFALLVPPFHYKLSPPVSKTPEIVYPNYNGSCPILPDDISPVEDICREEMFSYFEKRDKKEISYLYKSIMKAIVDPLTALRNYCTWTQTDASYPRMGVQTSLL